MIVFAVGKERTCFEGSVKEDVICSSVPLRCASDIRAGHAETAERVSERTQTFALKGRTCPLCCNFRNRSA